MQALNFVRGVQRAAGYVHFDGRLFPIRSGQSMPGRDLGLFTEVHEPFDFFLVRRK